MASATDIITYIGIPLAVLGVLPILYTFVLSIITSRRIRHLLIQHGHKPRGASGRNTQEGFMLRASPMTSLIEIEVPRYTIAPVDRSDERYWGINDHGAREEHSRLLGSHHIHVHEHGEEEGAHVVARQESTLSMMEEGRVRGFLRGGSWRTFHWRRLVVGRKLYRIQYEDELREPPAEIEFADLVNFLMDRGAELDETGWEKLRNGGLWTPAGTVLLKVCDEDMAVEADEAKAGSIGGSSLNGVVNRSGSDWILRTSMPDDSDGILTLCVQWPQGRGYGNARTAKSLPPGWGRLIFPLMSDRDEILANRDEKKDTTTGEHTLSSTIFNLAKAIPGLVESGKTSSLRFRLDSNLVTSVHIEFCNRPTSSVLSLSTLGLMPNGLEWFTTCASALLSLNNEKSVGTLYGFTTPPSLIAFARKDTVPAGVLVLLSILKPEQAPPWDLTSAAATQDLDRAYAGLHHKRFQARIAAERLEAAMPPDQARTHRLNREQADRRAQHEQFVEHTAAKRDRQRRRRQEAVVSACVGASVVAAACREWLIEHDSHNVPNSWEVEDIAHAVLWLIVLQAQTEPPTTTPPVRSTKRDEDTSTYDDQVKNTDEAKTQEEENNPNQNQNRHTVEDDNSRSFSLILHILEEWSTWSTAGGMKPEQFELLERHTREFCYAACLVAVVHRAVSLAGSSGVGGRKTQASVDMLECLRLWRKVRLG